MKSILNKTRKKEKIQNANKVAQICIAKYKWTKNKMYI